MKKLFALLLALPLILLTLSSFSPKEETATTITIKRSGIGPAGYNKIREIHSDDNKMHSLYCAEPGFDNGEWNILPKLRFSGKTVPEIETAVLNMMANSKTEEGDISYTRTIVEWKGTKDSYTITITEE